MRKKNLKQVQAIIFLRKERESLNKINIFSLFMSVHFEQLNIFKVNLHFLSVKSTNTVYVRFMALLLLNFCALVHHSWFADYRNDTKRGKTSKHQGALLLPLVIYVRLVSL